MAAPEPFSHVELLPLGDDNTDYRLVTREGVSVARTEIGDFLRVEAAAITRLTAEAMHDISHFLRASHLA
ncbi:MAG: fumarate hydratase, partial [Actinobacteria bacterium]|nr:fumarate hydratase [Actinomycetota bacterium]